MKLGLTFRVGCILGETEYLVEMGEKPGVCPKAHPGTITICPVRCQSDWQCDEKRKCCTYACITDCMDVILQGSGSAPPVPPCTKAEVAVLRLGCCPPLASSMSPDVLACLLVAPPCSGHYADRHSKTFLPQLTLMCHPG
uniref:WAP domain-containing protein n=1 Tax=Pseudonaja textilis TaxID=8673 RepID=A0A670ZM95_PSETE